MRLTLYTDYALRVLIHVAIADGKLITISDIAERFDNAALARGRLWHIAAVSQGEAMSAAGES
jgi:hypothetical protein